MTSRHPWILVTEFPERRLIMYVDFQIQQISLREEVCEPLGLFIIYDLIAGDGIHRWVGEK